MAKRELSSTLKNLKFMQRASLKDDKVKEVEKDKSVVNFGAVPAPARRCIVVVEGDPHPGALKGRMSFQSFNPSIDKLNEEAENNQQNVATASNRDEDSARVGEATAIGSRESRIGSNNGSEVDLKRKQPEADSNSTTPEEMLKIYSDQGLLSRMKLKVVCQKLYDYVRYDLKEIAFPSSLPDPPHIKKRRKLTWIERWYILKEATRIYAASWVRDIGPDLRPDDYKKNTADDNEFDRQSTPSDKKEPSMLEDLAVAARGGMETLRPTLQRIYMTRASAYKDALKGFIEGYQEELKRVVEGEKVDKPHSQDADVKKPN